MRSAGNRRQIYCLEGNNANLCTADAVNNFILQQKVLISSGTMMKFYLIPPLDTFENSNFILLKYMRQPGIVPGSIAWKAAMLSFTPPTLFISLYFAGESFYFFWADDEILYNTTTCYLWKLKFSILKIYASAGNRIRIYCMEVNNANLYIPNAVNNTLFCRRMF